MHAIHPTTTKLSPATIRDPHLLLPGEIPQANSSTEVSSPEPLSQDSLITFLPPQPVFFIGRKEQLENLHKTLQAKGTIVLIPEEDIPCQIGKTAITSQYAKDKNSVLWISAHNKKALDANFTKLGKLFNIDPSKVKEYLSAQERLIVFDGAQDSELLKDYIPQGKCQVIISSRGREWSFPKIEIGPFSVQDAIDFLCQATQKEDRMAAQRIAEELDCLPTSLGRAAKMIVEQPQAELVGYFGINEAILDMNNQRLKERSNLGDRNRNFTGREMGLVALEEAFKTSSRTVITAKRRIAAEVGLGGVGKTQIALQYAIRNADKYPYLIWRMNCESEETLLQSYRLLADRFNIALTEKKQENVIKKVNQKLEKEFGWLLIYDNAYNQKTLEDLIPQRGGHVLITSRSPSWDIGFAQVFKIGVFKRKESIALIQKMTSLNETEANQLAELVKDLPIAVAQSAAYIRQTSIAYEEYERLFKEKSQRLLHQQPTDEYSKTVDITWQISMKKIEEWEKAQAEALSVPCVASPLMNFCAFLGSSNIPKKELLLPWLKRGYNRGKAALDDLNRALQLLRNFSMVEIDENSASIHDLVQLVTRNQLKDSDQKQICGDAVRFLIEVIECEEGQIDVIKAKLSSGPHASRLVDHAWKLKVEEGRGIEVKDRVAYLLYFQGFYNEALKIWNQCLAMCIAMKLFRGIVTAKINITRAYDSLGNYLQAKKTIEEAVELAKNSSEISSSTRIISRNSLGIVLLHMGQAQDAQLQFEEALSLLNETHPNNQSLKAMTENNLGLSFLEQGKNSDALAHLQKSLDIKKKICHPSDPSLAETMQAMAKAFTSRGHPDEAISLYRKAENIQHQAHSAVHPELARLKNDSVFNQTTINEAIEQLQKVLSEKEKSLPTGHISIATTKTNLGGLFHQVGKLNDAEKMLTHALAIKIHALPSNHPSIANTRSSLGLLYEDMNRIPDAQIQFIEAIKIYENNTQVDHLPEANIRANYAKLLLSYLQNPEEAQKQLLQALQIHQKASHREHQKVAPPDRFLIADIQKSLGEALLKMSKPAEAIEQFKKALPDLETFLTPIHPIVAVTRYYLGEALLNIGDKSGAKSQFLQALSIYETSTPTDKLNIFRVRDKLGELYLSLDDFLGAKEQYIKILEIIEPLSIDPFIIAKTRTNLGMALHELKEYSKAEIQLKAALEVKIQAYSCDSPHLISTRVNLGNVCLDMQKYKEAEEQFKEAMRLVQSVYSPFHPIYQDIQRRIHLATYNESLHKPHV